MCIEKVRPVEEFKAHARIRQQAINDYYDNPNRCKHCNVILQIKCGERVTGVRRKDFCSHACSRLYYTSGGHKITLDDIKFCSCGKQLRNKYHKTCGDCLFNYNHYEVTIKQSFPKTTTHDRRYNLVRERAKRLADNVYNLHKHCPLCDSNEFDKVVHLCHIKAISEFNDETPLKVVNSKDNLIYLCPSHHEMFDNGYISLDTILQLKEIVV